MSRKGAYRTNVERELKHGGAISQNRYTWKLSSEKLWHRKRAYVHLCRFALRNEQQMATQRVPHPKFTPITWVVVQWGELVGQHVYTIFGLISKQPSFQPTMGKGSDKAKPYSAFLILPTARTLSPTRLVSE